MSCYRVVVVLLAFLLGQSCYAAGDSGTLIKSRRGDVEKVAGVLQSQHAQLSEDRSLRAAAESATTPDQPSTTQNVTSTPTVADVSTTTSIFVFPRRLQWVNMKRGAMVVIIVVVVFAFLYIAFANWRARKQKKHFRTFRGAREKMEMEPLGKHADDQEDEIVFDMSKPDNVSF